jgi:hypothetical protein
MADPQKLSTTMFRWVNSGGPVPVMVQARLNTGEVIGPMDELKNADFRRYFHISSIAIVDLPDCHYFILDFI